MLFEEATRRVAGLYPSRPAYWYVRSKLRMDPVTRVLAAVGETENFGEVVDVGSGRGQVGLLLRIMGLATAVTGIDWDEAKVAIANRAGAALDGVSFARGDVCDTPIPRADTVLLVDILHYLTHAQQDDLLARASRAARCRVIVRDVDPERGARSVVTERWEWVTTTLGYNRGARVAPRSFDAIAKVLEGHGLVVSREQCSARGLSNVLLIGRR